MISREKEAKEITSAIGADTLAAPSAPASFGHAGVAEPEQGQRARGWQR